MIQQGTSITLNIDAVIIPKLWKPQLGMETERTEHGREETLDD